MINDYHAVRVAKGLKDYPNEMVHELAHETELKMLELGIKVEEIAVLYESLKRQEPRVYGVTMEDGIGVKESVK